MSSQSARLGLPYIQSSQAQKHVTHNEALRQLDVLVQLTAEAADVSAPPETAAPGMVYIVPAGASGVWAGQAGHLAVYDQDRWVFVAAQEGWMAWDKSAGASLVFQAGTWETMSADAPSSLAHLGINTTADDVNRLSVKSQATLFSHPGTGGHQMKINKDAPADTASLLLQSGWSGRAEIGLAGEDDLSVKVSPDGSTFHTAIHIDRDTGYVSFPSGVQSSASEFGTSPGVTVDYITARGTDLFTNGTGLLGNTYNMPSGFSFAPELTPNLPGAFAFSGYYQANQVSSEFIAVDPSQVYRLRSAIYQDAAAGDFSAYTKGDLHLQYMGIDCYDVDGNQIKASHHMRYKHAGQDSLTELTAPLAPGDTVVQVADASGWNEASTLSFNRGVAIYGYRNSFNFQYDYYTRLTGSDLFDLGGVDKTAHQITLNAPFPASLGNPNDPSGIWPVGTRLANSSSSGTYKYAFFAGVTVPQTQQWFQAQNYIGGVDTSGTHNGQNFPPGTAYVRIVWLPNYTNRAGGYSTYPDTGADHKVRFSGISITPAAVAHTEPVTTGSHTGRQTLYVPHITGAPSPSVDVVQPSLQLTAL